MSEFRNLPQSFIAEQNDELLLATPTEARRISVKSFKYDALATLKFKHPADQSYGIGTADTWVKIPFNELTLTGADQWVQLNADGSFSLTEGFYFLRVTLVFLRTNEARLALRQDANFLEVNRNYAGDYTSSGPRSRGVLTKKISSTGQTFSVEVAIDNPSPYTFGVGDDFLAGMQATLADCEIHKLG